MGLTLTTKQCTEIVYLPLVNSSMNLQKDFLSGLHQIRDRGGMCMISGPTPSDQGLCMADRKACREATWHYPEWNDIVANTVPLVKSMTTRILEPLEFSPTQ